MKVLFVNACLRGEKSRTLQLCKAYLAELQKKNPEVQVEELLLDCMGLVPQDGDFIARRDVFLEKGDFQDAMFDLAKQFMAADHVVIGAPYWDLSFPAILKMYLERCSVDKLTFVYNEQGIPEGQCKAEHLTYITTAGGYIGNMNFGFEYVQGLATTLFGIKTCHQVSAEGLDIWGTDVEAKLQEAERKLSEIAALI